MSPFLWRIAAFTIGGMVTDGYILGHIGIALAIATPELGLNAAWLGLIAASILLGILFGAPLAGRLSDRFGRKRLLAIDFVVLVVGSALHLAITDETSLVVLRFIMGIAIGAEYAIGAVLLSEIAPQKQRSVLLASLNAGWVVGFVTGFLAAYTLREFGASWQLIFASTVVPALIVLLMRTGSPESPRWLVSKGRNEEARAIVHKHFGQDYDITDLAAAADADRRASLADLFAPAYRRRTLFAGIFWACQVVPLFALTIFLPQVFNALGIATELGAEMFVNSALLIGAAAGILAIRLFTRRGFTIWSFILVATALLVMALSDDLPVVMSLVAFAVFVLVGSAASNLEFVYPSEIFPTEVRATGLGFAAAVSRVGAAISTFLLPIALQELGSRWTMLLLAIVAAIGALISVAWAPETNGLSLDQASRVSQEPLK